LSWKIYLAQCELAKFTCWIFELITPRRKILIYERKLPKNDSKNLDSNVWRHWSWKNNIFSKQKPIKKTAKDYWIKWSWISSYFFLLKCFSFTTKLCYSLKYIWTLALCLKKSFALIQNGRTFCIFERTWFFLHSE